MPADPPKPHAICECRRTHWLASSSRVCGSSGSRWEAQTPPTCAPCADLLLLRRRLAQRQRAARHRRRGLRRRLGSSFHAHGFLLSLLYSWLSSITSPLRSTVSDWIPFARIAPRASPLSAASAQSVTLLFAPLIFSRAPFARAVPAAMTLAWVTTPVVASHPNELLAIPPDATTTPPTSARV